MGAGRPQEMIRRAGACPLQQLQKTQGGWGVSVSTVRVGCDASGLGHRRFKTLQRKSIVLPSLKRDTIPLLHE
jgi:hypothetical protein